MNKKTEQFLHSVRIAVSLSDNEKKEMRDTLSAYVDSNPVQEGIATYPEMAPVQLWFAGFIKSKKAVYVTVPLVAILFLGGGITVAAHDALPGDTLYPVKIGFNEEVRGLLAFTDTEEAAWNAERAERRLEEAEALAIANKLDNETRVHLEEKFKEYTERSEKNTASLAVKGDIETAAERQSDLEGRLRAHTEVLEAIHGQEKDGAEVEVFLGSVRDRATAASHARASFEAQEQMSTSSRAREALRKVQEMQIIKRQSSALGLDVAVDVVPDDIEGEDDVATSSPDTENEASDEVDMEENGAVKGVQKGKKDEVKDTEEQSSDTDTDELESNTGVEAEPRLSMTQGNVLY